MLQLVLVRLKVVVLVQLKVVIQIATLVQQRWNSVLVHAILVPHEVHSLSQIRWDKVVHDQDNLDVHNVDVHLQCNEGVHLQCNEGVHLQGNEDVHLQCNEGVQTLQGNEQVQIRLPHEVQLSQIQMQIRWDKVVHDQDNLDIHNVDVHLQPNEVEDGVHLQGNEDVHLQCNEGVRLQGNEQVQIRWDKVQDLEIQTWKL